MKTQTISKEFKETATFVYPWGSLLGLREIQLDRLRIAYKAIHGIPDHQRLPNGILPQLKTLLGQIEKTFREEREKMKHEKERAQRRWERETPEGRKAVRERRQREHTTRHFRAAYNECSYRVSKSSWGGGDHTTNIFLHPKEFYDGSGRTPKDVWCAGYSNESWSSNGKWKGKDSLHNFHIKPDWNKQVYKKGLAVVDGVLTLDAKKISHTLPKTCDMMGDGVEHKVEMFEAEWVVQGRGFDLNKRMGFIVKAGNLTFHAHSLNNAKRVFSKRVEGYRESVDEAALDFEQRFSEFSEHMDVMVTLADSKRAGNCESGTLDWVQKHFAKNRKQATVREILEVAQKTHDRLPLVKRALKVAVSRCSKSQDSPPVERPRRKGADHLSPRPL